MFNLIIKLLTADTVAPLPEPTVALSQTGLDNRQMGYVGHQLGHPSCYLILFNEFGRIGGFIKSVMELSRAGENEKSRHRSRFNPL